MRWMYLLLELVHEPVLLPLQSHHFLLGFLAFGGRQLQQGNVGVLLTDGCQQSLLPEVERKRGLHGLVDKNIEATCVYYSKCKCGKEAGGRAQKRGRTTPPLQLCGLVCIEMPQRTHSRALRQIFRRKEADIFEVVR